MFLFPTHHCIFPRLIRKNSNRSPFDMHADAPPETPKLRSFY